LLGGLVVGFCIHKHTLLKSFPNRLKRNDGGLVLFSVDDGWEEIIEVPTIGIYLKSQFFILSA
jgi:hypothetical protein